MILSLYVLFVYYYIQLIMALQNSNISMSSENIVGSQSKVRNIFFGALFPIHRRGIKSNECGKKINVVRGIQRLEAIYYAIDQINNNNNILKNLYIYSKVIDTCDGETKALEETVASVINHIKGATCNYVALNKQEEKIIGFIGASRSAVSIEVANLLRLFEIPQISFASTSSVLNDRKRYKYFLRTVPPDTYQAQAMIDVCKQLKWTAVAVVYSAGQYGESAFEALIQNALIKNICIVKSFKLSKDTDYDDVLEQIKSHTNTKVIISVCLFHQFEKLLSATSKGNVSYTWLTGEIYGFQKINLKTQLLKETADGSIILSLKRLDLLNQDFMNYFNKLTPSNNHRNKWFDEYWEQKYNCTIKESKTCLTNNKPKETIYDDKIVYVIDAVYALACAVDVIYKTCCPEQDGICETMKTVAGKEVLNQLTTSKYKGVFGETRFDTSGNTNHGYEISYYKDGNLQQVGEWNEKVLEINEDKIRKVTSYCAEPCADGYVKMMMINSPICCFACVKCRKNHITSVNQDGCIACQHGTRPNAKRNQCQQLPLRHLQGAWVIAIAILAGLGIIITIWFMLVFYYHKDSEIVMTSAPELSYPLLIGVLLSYMLTFFMIADQTIYLCGVRRFGLGFCFSICYSAILTKTNRLARVFKENQSKPARYVDAVSQLLILCALVFLQCGISLIGFFINAPTLELIEESDHDHVIKVCFIPWYDKITLYAYNFILVSVSTTYAFRTRKVPACFNEARNIGFVMYTTLVLWISFIPAYLVSINKSNEVIAICMNLVLHATSILTGVFGPKIYMIVFRWERTQRKGSLHSVTQNHIIDNSTDGRMPRKMTSVSLYSEISKIRSTSYASSNATTK